MGSYLTPGWPVWLRGNFRTFLGLSTTCSRPIPEIMYHIRQCLSYDTKTLTAYFSITNHSRYTQTMLQ